MKECFVITTYCNTSDRIEELKKCIKNLNRFNIDILIHAHYPLNSDIQQSVKYYIYDSTNPVIRDGSKVIIRWKWYVTANKLLTIINPDYSYAVMNQWCESMKFLKEKEYDIIHVINYDTFISDFIFKKHQESLLNHDAIFEYTNLNVKDYNANESNKKLMYIVFFSIKKTFIDVFTNELTLDKYLQSKDTMLETYLMEVIDNIENKSKDIEKEVLKNKFAFGLDIFKIKKIDDSQFKLDLGDAINIENTIKKEECDVYTTISEANGFDLINIGYCYVFGGHNKEHDKFEILIFEISKPINNITININGQFTIVDRITDKYYSLITEYNMNQINEIIDNNKLSIIIDDKIIDDKIINAMKYQGIQPKFN